MSEAKPFPLNAWYAAAWGHEIKHELAARTVCEKDIVLYRRSDGEVAALEDACWHRLVPLSLGQLVGDDVMCGYHGIRLQLGRPLHLHAGPEDHQPVGLRARLSRRRAPPHGLGLARRPGPRGPGQGARLPLERRHRMGRRGRHLLRPEVRLPPHHRQPDGPDPRDLRPRRLHRPRRHHRHALRHHPHGPDDDGDALDARHRAAAVLGKAARQAGQRRPLADHPLRGALDRRRRRRRRPRRHRRAGGRPLARGSTGPSSPRSRRKRRPPATTTGTSSACSTATTTT